MKVLLLLLLIFGCVETGFARTTAGTIKSPGKDRVVTCDVAKAIYTISYKGASVLQNSKLEVVKEDEDLSNNLQLVKLTTPVIVKESYRILNKRKSIIYFATQQVFETKTASGKKMNIIFRTSNDGLAFQYEFPEISAKNNRSS